MAGCWTICSAPMTPSTTNQTVMIGPNSLPTAPVPNRCAMKSATMTATEIGSTKGLKAGVIDSRPSTAPSTEIAGVMTLSP